ncbi:MAG: DNA-3-methyladenine glycosylase family protein, partial [Candidatus Acidiferrum sp.]
MTAAPPTPPFDLAEAVKHLLSRDEKLKLLIAETESFKMDLASDGIYTPYDSLLEAITHQSISGKAAATIFARIKALSSTGGVPTPQEMIKLRTQVLRKAGLSGAKAVAMKDLAKKTIAGVVPSLEESQKLSDEELVKRLTSVRGIGA